MFDTAKCDETTQECMEFLGLSAADYTSIQSGISEDGLTFTVSFYDVTGALVGTHTVVIEP
jgi:hypothetical protein